MSEHGKVWWLYLLVSDTIKYSYTGISTDPERRLIKHNTGKGAKFTRGRGPWRIVGTHFGGNSRGEATRYERYIKSLTRSDRFSTVGTSRPDLEK